MLIPIIFAIALSAQPVQPIEFLGESELRRNLSTLVEHTDDPTGRRIVAEYLATVDRLKDVQRYGLTIAKARSFTVDMWAVNVTRGTPALPGQYERVMKTASTIQLRFLNSDYYYDAKQFADLANWLDTLSTANRLNLRPALQQARQGFRQIRTTAVILSTIVRLVQTESTRGLIVAKLDDLPGFVEVMNRLGLTSFVIIDKNAVPNTDQAKRKTSST